MLLQPQLRHLNAVRRAHPQNIVTPVQSVPILLVKDKIGTHRINTNPNDPVFFPSINSSVSRSSTFMYESMLSNVPLYSVWPHFRRITISVPTLLSVRSPSASWFVIWARRVGRKRHRT